MGNYFDVSTPDTLHPDQVHEVDLTHRVDAECTDPDSIEYIRNFNGGGSKVDIIDDLDTPRADAALSANQGVKLKSMNESFIKEIHSMQSSIAELVIADEILKDEIKKKQDGLVSGTNIKSINNVNLLDKGDLRLTYAIGLYIAGSGISGVPKLVDGERHFDAIWDMSQDMLKSIVFYGVGTQSELSDSAQSIPISVVRYLDGSVKYIDLSFVYHDRHFYVTMRKDGSSYEFKYFFAKLDFNEAP